MPVKYAEIPEKKRVEFVMNGHLSKADYDSVVAPLQNFIDAHGKIQMIEVIESFTGFDPAVLMPGMQFDIQNIKHISHVALVTDIGWMSPIAQATSTLLPTKIRSFALGDLKAARAWLDAEATCGDAP